MVDPAKDQNWDASALYAVADELRQLALAGEAADPIKVFPLVIGSPSLVRAHLEHRQMWVNLPTELRVVIAQAEKESASIGAAFSPEIHSSFDGMDGYAVKTAELVEMFAGLCAKHDMKKSGNGG
jgi:hypothetical protein